MVNLGKNKVDIVGAGLVGTLLALYFREVGCKVEIFEKRQDPRLGLSEQGRSINLALSHRGLHALEKIGLKEDVLKLCIPMNGRMIHTLEGSLNYQPYSEEGHSIYSVSRYALNELLVQQAEFRGVRINFNSRLAEVNFDQYTFSYFVEGEKLQNDYNHLFGTDGAFSVLRKKMQVTDRFNYSQTYIDHGYKELHIPSDNGIHVMDKNALHIWPRENFMLIALPNLDGSFTCTLFLAHSGKFSFDYLKDESSAIRFFEDNFADAYRLMPNFVKDFFTNPTSSLVYISCNPWQHKKTYLLGDAAHAIVPFYGQGMNAGFEDVRLLFDEIISANGDIEKAFSGFHKFRKFDVEAISKLALNNFIEMRDLVDDADFILRKKIESMLHKEFPERYKSLYSIVSFSDISYREALNISDRQNIMFKEIFGLIKSEDDINDVAKWKEILAIFNKIFPE